MLPPDAPADVSRDAPARAARGAGQVVVLGNDAWDSQWRRKQQLFSRLARHRPVDYCDPPFSPLDFLRGRRVLGDWLRAPRAVQAAEGGVRVVTGAAGVPGAGRAAWIRLVNARRQRSWARRWLERVDAPAHPAVICYEPLLHPIDARVPEARWIYDVIDDYAQLEPRPRLRARIARGMEGLARRSDLTIVTNDRLAERLRPFARRLVVLPHGVDTEQFRPGAHRGTRFAPLAEEPGIKAVFPGTLNERIDRRLLEALLRAGITVVLAGECAWPPRVLDQLRAHGRLQTLGLLPADEVPALVAACDVGIIPYQPLGGMASVQTLKRLEFHACGLPIVATDMEPYRDLANELRLADGPAAFVAAVTAAAREPRPNATHLALARANTWEARVTQLAAWLDAPEPPGRPHPDAPPPQGQPAP